MTRPKGEGIRHVEKEIAREKAATLALAGERLEAAIEEARALARRLDATRNSAERERLHEEYQAARRRARQARQTLVIQREAVGLRQHRILEQLFPEPPEVR